MIAVKDFHVDLVTCLREERERERERDSQQKQNCKTTSIEEKNFNEEGKPKLKTTWMVMVGP